jgi:A/G-specific adenine glycosylase
MGKGGAAAETLLAWYDRSARRLPWRVPPGAGAPADPYRVWLSEVMLQQTTVAVAGRYFVAFTERWPTVFDLAAAEDAEVMAAWAGLGYYARARNLLACARVVAGELGGRFPEDEAGLAALPGVGAYTAAAIAAIAFGRPAVVVDGNVERVMARRFAVGEPLPGAKGRLRELAAGLTPVERAGDYAQAVMDLGATICTPRSPACGICPWNQGCSAREAGIQAELPRRAEKPARPVRRGTAWLALRADGAVLVETRPPEGLLGGMLGLPGDGWAERPMPARPMPARPPFAGDWREVGEVRHTFTHFHLVLEVMGARVPAAMAAPFGRFEAAERLERALPSVMRKALRTGLGAMRDSGLGRKGLRDSGECTMHAQRMHDAYAKENGQD